MHTLKSTGHSLETFGILFSVRYILECAGCDLAYCLGR